MTSGAIHKHKDKKDKKTHEKKLKKKKKVSRSVHDAEDGVDNAEDSGEGSVDLCEELHPIGYYINDREEMINQMFSVIRGDKLRAMLPPVLKDSTVDELKSHCLDELLGMSSKRIHSILEGRELETSSDSDDASSDPENENAMGTSPDNKDQWSSDDMRTGTQDKDLGDLDKEDIISDERNGLLNGPVPDIDTLEIGITRKEMGELLNYIPSTKHSERKRSSSACEPETTVSVAKRSKSRMNSQKKAKESEKQIKDSTENISQTDEIGSSPESGNISEGNTAVKSDESKGKTLLEILELEMRARAIRALLKQQIGGGDGEDVEQCDERSETSPSELRKSPSLYMVKDAASSYHESSKDNLTRSGSFNTSPKSRKQKLKHNKGMENIPAKTGHTNNHCFTVSPELSLAISAIHHLPSSAKNAELCTLTKTDCTVDPDVDQVANGNVSQNNSCNNVKTEVYRGGKTQDVDIVKHVPLFESNDKGQESNLDMLQCKEIYEPVNTAVMLDDPDKEDGELTNDDKSSESVLEVQSEKGGNDIIILDNSDDDALSELHAGSKLQKISVQQKNDSQKLSLENVSKQDYCSNDSCTSPKVSGTLNTASKECNVKPHKSSVSYENSGSTPEDAAKSENNECSSSCIETEVNEDYRSENQNKRSETTDCSWAARWLQSKDVQKVVSTSKMCAKIRKRMKSAQKVKRVSSGIADPEEDCRSSVVVVGSVNEYNMLDRPKFGDSGT